MCRANAESIFRSDHCRADIECGAPLRRHPVVVHTEKSIESFEKNLRLEGRLAEALGGLVEALDMIESSEDMHRAIGPPESFQAFENCLAVVQRKVGRIKRERLIGLDAGTVPSTLPGMFHQEHVIGKMFAEAELRNRGKWLAIVRADDAYLHGGLRNCLRMNPTTAAFERGRSEP